MIYGHLTAPDTYSFLLANPAWRTAFDWLRTVSPEAPKGRQPLQGDAIYVNVHGYATQPVETCVFESHRRYVDLQYCITGGEVIEWAKSGDLSVRDPYKEPEDVMFYHRPAGAVTRLQMIPGSFAIFYPSDAHAPKVSNGVDAAVFKLVIKVDASLLGG